MWKTKLIALNLALLLLGAVAAPALAAGPEADAAPYVPSALESAPKLQDNSYTSYSISVDGTSFSSDQDASGGQWRYSAGNRALYLTGYHGGPIYANGDLDIYVQEGATVTSFSDTHVSRESGIVSGGGGGGSIHSGNGISVTGSLFLSVESGSLQVSGADCQSRGGHAIYAADFYYRDFVGSDACFRGGDATDSEYTSELLGGCGIKAEFIMLMGTGTVSISGGSAPSSVPYSTGGDGISTDIVYLDSDCTIAGGSGYSCGSGIQFGSYCQFGNINATVTCPGPAGNAIYNPDGEPWNYSEHTTVSSTDTSVTITQNCYTLQLYGGSQDAVLPGGASWTSLQAYYPTIYDLTNYSFQRPGHVQLAWTGSGYSASDPLPLNSLFIPVANCALYAYWTKADPGDIILNALHGKLADGSFYQRTAGASATLPSQVSYEDEESSLLGWCSLPTPIWHENYIYPGQWYEGGDVIPSDPGQVTQLYAQENSHGAYVIYHPGAGSLEAGGNVLVQGSHGSVSSSTDLYAYTPNGIQLIAPEGYTLAGWSTDETSSEVAYLPGAETYLPADSVRHLYAVWQPTEYTCTVSGLTITSIPLTKTIRVEIPEAWVESTDYTAVCALYKGDRLVDCAISPSGTGVLELQYQGDTPPLCKVFALGEDRQPLCAPAVYDPTQAKK